MFQIFLLTLDEHGDGSPQRLGGEGGVLRLARDVPQVVPGRGAEPQHRGHRPPVGQSALVIAVLAPA